MITYSPFFRNLLINQLVAQFIEGATVKIYDRTTANQILLITLTVGMGGGFVKIADGTAQLIGMPSTNILASGVATHIDFIAPAPASNLLFTASCGLQDSNAAIFLNNVNLVAGLSFVFDSAIFIFPSTQG